MGRTTRTAAAYPAAAYPAAPAVASHNNLRFRTTIAAATDAEVVEALKLTIRKEGLIPALESSHAFAQAFKEVGTLSPSDCILINQSGRGDKDIFTVADAFQDPLWEEFIQRKAEGYRRA